MDTFVNYWVKVIWIIGAVVTTGALLLALASIYHALLMNWGKRVGSDFLFHLWLYRAMRAWERKGNPRPKTVTKTERQKLEECAQELIAFARDNGYVLTITTEPKPLQPLAMGNSLMVYDVRESRELYTAEWKKS